MNVSRALRILPLSGVLILAACDTDRVTDPMTETTSLSAEDRISLEVIGDSGAVQAAMDLIDIPLATTARRGMAWGTQASAASTAELAREMFREAVREMNAQDSLGAADRAREARRLVVRAMIAIHGPGAVSGLIERAEELAAAATREQAMYANGFQLRMELGDLALRARQRLQLRDSTGAGESAVLAEQRHRQRFGDPGARPGGASVAVELGHTSVSLATRLVNAAGGADESKARLLAVAGDYADAASEALEAGRLDWAVHLAELARWTALESVVWPDGVSADEARAMMDLAETLFADAIAAAPTGIEEDLLERARALIDFGAAALAEAEPRGIGALWHAAVICTWILG